MQERQVPQACILVSQLACENASTVQRNVPVPHLLTSTTHRMGSSNGKLWEALPSCLIAALTFRFEVVEDV